VSIVTFHVKAVEVNPQALAVTARGFIFNGLWNAFCNDFVTEARYSSYEKI